MFRAMLLQVLFLSATFPAASAVSLDSDNHFVRGSLVVACIFLFLSLLQMACCFVAIVMMRGHRLPYLALFVYIVCTTIVSIISIADIIAPRIPSHGFFLYTCNWLLIGIFTAIVTFLRDRETTIRAQSNTTRGQRNVAHSMVYIALVVLMFGFAMTPAFLSTNVANNTVDVLNYIVCTLIILSAIYVFVTAIIISRAVKDAATADKVINIILYAVSPLFSLLTFLHVVFLIVFSSATPSSFASSNAADLAQYVIVHFLIFVIFGILLFLSFDRASWDFGNTLPASTIQQGQQPLAPQVVQYPAGMQVPSPQPHEYVPPQPYLQQDAAR